LDKHASFFSSSFFFFWLCSIHADDHIFTIL
jgi:hypothetical protein